MHCPLLSDFKYIYSIKTGNSQHEQTMSQDWMFPIHPIATQTQIFSSAHYLQKDDHSPCKAHPDATRYRSRLPLNLFSAMDIIWPRNDVANYTSNSLRKALCDLQGLIPTEMIREIIVHITSHDNTMDVFMYPTCLPKNYFTKLFMDTVSKMSRGCHEYGIWRILQNTWPTIS